MLRLRAFVKPVRQTTWRLGVIEEIREDGRFKVHLHVAPAGAYAGSALVLERDELVEVPRARVEGYLQVKRAEIAQAQTLVQQLEGALAEGHAS